MNNRVPGEYSSEAERLLARGVIAQSQGDLLAAYNLAVDGYLSASAQEIPSVAGRAARDAATRLERLTDDGLGGPVQEVWHTEQQDPPLPSTPEGWLETAISRHSAAFLASGETAATRRELGASYMAVGAYAGKVLLRQGIRLDESETDGDWSEALRSMETGLRQVQAASSTTGLPFGVTTVDHVLETKFPDQYIINYFGRYGIMLGASGPSSRGREIARHAWRMAKYSESPQTPHSNPDITAQARTAAARRARLRAAVACISNTTQLASLTRMPRVREQVLQLM